MAKPKPNNDLASLGSLLFGDAYTPQPEQSVQPESGAEPEMGRQNLRIELDKKARNGKAVTLVTGFNCTPFQLEKLGKQLRSKLGVGGSEKNDELTIQGDQRKKLNDILLSMGHRVKLIGG